jgi:hypothetical protein
MPSQKYRIRFTPAAMPGDASERLLAAAETEHNLRTRPEIRGVKRAGTTITFRSTIALDTGARTGVSDAIDYVGGFELRRLGANGRAIPVARSRADVDFGGSSPPTDVLRYDCITNYPTVEQAKAAVVVLRGNPFVFRWRRDGARVSITSSVSVREIPGFVRGD